VGLDIRLPIGMMFGILGILLCAYGALADPAIYQQHSLGVNVNVSWGAVLIVFAGVMLFLGRRGARAAAQAPAAPEMTNEDRRPKH
jgi:hypothetical protein